MEIRGQPTTAVQIPCCLCGTLIIPNAANQCGSCLAQQFDLKSTLQRGPGGGDIYVNQCRRCRRYEHSEHMHAHHEPESPELLALCLKNIPALHANNHQHRSQGLSGIKLMESIWIWTEPHSMRLKLRLTVRVDVGEPPRDVTVQQRVPVEFIVRFQQCRDCNRDFTSRTWHALVQLRQKRSADGPRKGLAMLEAAIAKNTEIRKHILNMEVTKNGFDFYFMEFMHAQAFSSFLARITPMKVKTTQKLVSEDVRNNSAHIKHTTVCDIVPLCRDDLIICDKRAAKDGCAVGQLSGRLCLVNKISGFIQLVDASPSRNGIDLAFADLHTEKYWRGEKYYNVVFSGKRMTRFIVLDVELCQDDHHVGNFESDDTIYNGPHCGLSKYAMADVEVAREDDFGSSDHTFHCTTHLGNLLQTGDTVLGYDLVACVLPGSIDSSSMKDSFTSHFEMPDIVLVKKVHSSILDDTVDDETAQKYQTRAKSSGSKRRERRNRKEKKKLKAIEEAAGRMGLHEGTDMSEGGLWEQERVAFENELKNDPELANELERVETELAKGKFVSSNKSES